MIGFLLVATVVIVVPGPDFALTVRNAVTRRAGFATAAGVVSGQVCWVFASAAGLSAVLLESQRAFDILRLVGAAYLVYLGVSALLAAWRGAALHQPRRFGVRSPYAQGLLSNLANPKMPVFFISLLPQFGATFAELALHGLAFAAITLVWLSLVGHAAALLRIEPLQRAVDAIAGVVLVTLGLHLAAERR
ncbi:MAG TPA: LysE family translocator [Gaiellaceae bacterium]|nr:LysE family translocator [Gaiellaceae bacterium]